MPLDISYDEYVMDFIPGGIQLSKNNKQPFKMHSLRYCDTKE